MRAGWLLWLVGCGGAAPEGFEPADLSDPDTLAHLERQLHPDLLSSWGNPFLGTFPKCESVFFDKDGGVIFDGWCEQDDLMLYGRAVRTSTSASTRIVYNGLVLENDVSCTNGTWSNALSTSAHRVEVRYDGVTSRWADGSAWYSLTGHVRTFPKFGEIESSCDDRSYAFVLDYSGAVSTDGTWTAEGTYADTLVGEVAFETPRRDDDPAGTRCTFEPVSGSTTYRAGEREAVLVYDGAVACDGATPWTLDGEPQEMAVFTKGCSTSPGAAGWLGLGLVMLARRRRFAGTMAS